MIGKSKRTLFYLTNMIFESMTFFIAAVLLGGVSTVSFSVTFTLVYLAAVSLPLLLFLRTDRPSGWILFLFMPLSLLLFHFGAEIPPLAAVILGIALVWRCSVNWIEPIKSDAEIIFIMTLIAVLILSFVYSEERASVLLAAGCFQAFLLLLLKLSNQWGSSGRTFASKELKLAGIIIGAAAVAGSLVAAFKLIFTGALTAIFHALNFLVIMPLYKLVSILPLPEDWLLGLEEMQNKMDDQKKPDEKLQKLNLSDGFADLEWLAWTIAAALLCIALFILYKKKMNWQAASSRPINAAASSYQASYNITDKKRRWFQSENIIRKQMAMLEKEMHKNGQSRYPGESINQWFDRLKLNTSEAGIIQDIYEKVRYGETLETDDERKKFKHSLKIIREKLKKDRSQNA
ncbi:hypothetical protein ACFFJY_15440 [Fictibacillus aquaticus]|uniref:DUF4129 domain-containing protein n=1 Tax=Fictibacillus aquaticus TaxID=2021314 RepID=A0A235FEG2_9BACL|nr:hypothetical protein [Fictibacillus aquaticus]OYD59602.1 hypothetical protein CGZ90_06855 [Fictibacillus aquaticus]